MITEMGKEMILMMEEEATKEIDYGKKDNLREKVVRAIGSLDRILIPVRAKDPMTAIRLNTIILAMKAWVK